MRKHEKYFWERNHSMIKILIKDSGVCTEFSEGGGVHAGLTLACFDV